MMVSVSNEKVAFMMLGVFVGWSVIIHLWMEERIRSRTEAVE